MTGWDALVRRHRTGAGGALAFVTTVLAVFACVTPTWVVRTYTITLPNNDDPYAPPDSGVATVHCGLWVCCVNADCSQAQRDLYGITASPPATAIVASVALLVSALIGIVGMLGFFQRRVVKTGRVMLSVASAAVLCTAASVLGAVGDYGASLHIGAAAIMAFAASGAMWLSLLGYWLGRRSSPDEPTAAAGGDRSVPLLGADNGSADVEAGGAGPRSGLGWADGLSRAPHIRAAIFSLGMWVTAGMWLYCWGSGFAYVCGLHNVQQSTGAQAGCGPVCSFVGGDGWMLALVYVVYLIESFASDSSRFLRNFHIVETVYQYVARIKTHPPYIWWHVQCYHYEIIVRTRTYKDSDGNTRTETYTERKRVNTHSASGHYEFAAWADKSGFITGLQNFLLTKIKYSKTYTFANPETERHYRAAHAAWKAAHRRDKFQEYTDGLKIKDFTTHQLSAVAENVVPPTLGLPWYILSTLMLVSWPYRLWFTSITGRKSFTFVKQVNMRAY